VITLFEYWTGRRWKAIPTTLWNPLAATYSLRAIRKDWARIPCRIQRAWGPN
jgi:hypothetical protein